MRGGTLEPPRSLWLISEWEFREARRRINDAFRLIRPFRGAALRGIATDYGVSIRTLYRWRTYDVREVAIGEWRALYIIGAGEPSRMTRWERAA